MIMKPFIEFKDFSFKYDAQKEPTLKSLNLTIEKGQKVLIIGPSGCGKSTLAQTINGIIPNTYQGESTGSLMINGQPAFHTSIYEKSHLVSTVLQDTDGQFIGLSVAEDLAFALENDCCQQAEMVHTVHSWADKLELLDLLDHRPQDLSGGQKQRVSLAGVLIDESPILLFDEPLANLDPKSGQDTIALIDQLHQETGATTLIIEHRLEDVLYRPVDKVVLLNDGQILFEGSPDQLLASEILAENGIREPLYITVLRQLGLDMTNLSSLSDLENLNLPQIDFAGQRSSQSSQPKEPLLNVNQLSFGYSPNHPILKSIHLDLARGERIALVGKNGAGKSTLAKALTKFVEASGEFLWQGQDISDDSIKERASRIGYVLQNPNQMISQTMIFDEVAKGLRLRGLGEKAVEEKVLASLRTCGLYEFRQWPISALSYGQKKRVTIASILVLEPEIILLDEPTAGQDMQHYTEIMDFLDELNQAGQTIVMITHDMQLMLDYSDRCLVIADGKILADKSPMEVLSDRDLLRKANLKETSIFRLADKLGLDPLALSQFYRQKKEELTSGK
ncbi:ABC transporter, ATP-binding protein [Streptococcus criceti HS-6]|uniref:ABC transporter, ATP-binding protein n=2 Tax=Streptococcus criceti TaxID=1333 RepID=G5JSS8_STRCG|nr:ABC transporter, ATP-binding protein [Streptococcus criceti HS-6]